MVLLVLVQRLERVLLLALLRVRVLLVQVLLLERVLLRLLHTQD